MTNEIDQKPKKLKLRWKLLIGLLLYIVLVLVESQIIGHIDRKVRTDRSIFVGYVERLPNPINLKRFSSQKRCEYPRIWGLWTFSICLTRTDYNTPRSKSADVLFPCPTPFYTVEYIPPNSILLPDLPTWRHTPFYLRPDKTICFENVNFEER